MPSLFRKRLTDNGIRMKPRFHLPSHAVAWEKIINGSGKDNTLMTILACIRAQSMMNR